MKLLAAGYVLRADGVIEIDPDIAYPEILEQLGLREDALTQYCLEKVYQFAKLHARRLIAGTEHDPRRRRVSLQVHILSGADKRRWQIRRRPPGKGVDRATKFGEAKRHYLKLFGR